MMTASAAARYAATQTGKQEIAIRAMPFSAEIRLPYDETRRPAIVAWVRDMFGGRGKAFMSHVTSNYPDTESRWRDVWLVGSTAENDLVHFKLRWG